ncbi:MAG: hypothetical protein RL220_636 [Bacteroidota bacterium]
MRHSIATAAIIAISSFFHVKAQDTLTVLYIGNEYTSLNSLPTMVEQVTESLGNHVDWYSVSPDGFTLEAHSSNNQTTSALSALEWDFVIIQEKVSQLGLDNSSFASDVMPYAQDICDGARQANPCVKPVFFMPWAGEEGDPLNCLQYPWVCTNEEQGDTLKSRTLQLAVSNDAWCAPVGEAWNWLIDLSDGSIPMYTADGISPTPSSTYLSACVLYSVLFQEVPDGAYFPGQLGEENAELIQAVAGNTVIGSASEWNFTPLVWADLIFETGPIFTTVLLDASAAVDSVQIEFEDQLLVWEPGGSGAFTLGSGWIPYYLTIYSSCGNAEYLDSLLIPVSVTEMNGFQPVRTFPNPTSGPISVLVPLTGWYDIVILDVNGSAVFRDRRKIEKDVVNQIFPADLSCGIYTILLLGDSVNYSARVMRLPD